MATDVLVPALGESITEGTLAQWLKKPGDAVAADEPIASLETDKVTVEVPSPVAGTFGEALVNEGATVAVGATIARINEGAAAPASAPAAAAAPASAQAPASVSTPAPAQQAAAATTNPAGAGENPALRGDDHAPEPAAAGGAQPVAPAQAGAPGQESTASSATPQRGPGLRRDDGNERKEERVPMSRLRKTIAARLK